MGTPSGAAGAGVAIRFLFGGPSVPAHALRGGYDKFACLLTAQQRQRVTVEVQARFTASPAVGGMRVRVDAVDDNLLAAAQYFDLVRAAVG
jgi:hypothetical protein